MRLLTKANDRRRDAPGISESLGTNPTLAQLIRAAKELEHCVAELDPLSIAILRNVTLEPALPAAIKVSAAQSGLFARVYMGDFDDVEAQAYDRSSPLYETKPDIIVVALHLQTIAPRLVQSFASLTPLEVTDLCESALSRLIGLTQTIRNHSNATILVHNFEQPIFPAYGILDAQKKNGQRRTFADLNARLADGLAQISGAFVVDVDRLVAELGHERAMDNRYWHIARAPYSFRLQQRLAREYVTFATALKGKAKKCLVLDCDNTLWGGVIGEDGVAGIALGSSAPGSAYMELHAAVLDLHARGVLLALASKNNESDVAEVFTKHPASLLKLDHFVASRINWQDKATSLREIAAELNIGLDALVFVDDSAFECSFIREALPEVTVVELPSDASRFADLIRDMPYFETLTLSQEDRRRSDLYQANAARNALRASSESMGDYLSSLKMTVTITTPADTYSIPRIAQLTQKTNQFNLTTRRYAESDIALFAADPAWHIYCVDVSDRFDDSGIIGAALVHDEFPTARIDTFLLSCRVIGRGIEHALMTAIADDCRERSCDRLTSEYIATPKNRIASTFLADYGFTKEDSLDDRWWLFDVSRQTREIPAWFQAVRRTASVLT